MADKKISELLSAVTINTGDLLVVVQNGTTLKCDVSTFLSKMPAAPIITESIEALTSAGAISTAKRSTTITSAAGNTAYTLAAGTHGQHKIICAQAMGAGATATVTVTGGTGFTTLTFNAAGDFIKLENVNGYWFIAGNNSVTVV